MLLAYLLFLLPLVLFVLAFLYETFLGFRRLQSVKLGKTDYVHATWEVTHTLLIFSVVVLLMLFTKSIDKIASTIFVSTFLAAVALVTRSICYMYIFYVRKSKKVATVDWIFALSHVFAALFLVVTVIKALWLLYKERPEANTQFIPMFIPGLLFVVALSALPILYLYRTKSGKK